MIKILIDSWIIPTIVVVIVGLIVALIAYFIKTYNKLVKERNKVKNAWSQVDVQLKMRFDLIPNLVETIKGYTKHESSIFEEFAKARQLYADASRNHSAKDAAKADSALGKSLDILVNAVHESYPELKADKNYNDLMAQLKEIEKKIAFNRQLYNDVVLGYNNKIEMFPSNIIAGMFHFVKEEFFQIDEGEKAAPKVSF